VQSVDDVLHLFGLAKGAIYRQKLFRSLLKKNIILENFCTGTYTTRFISCQYRNNFCWNY